MDRSFFNEEDHSPFKTNNAGDVTDRGSISMTIHNQPEEDSTRRELVKKQPTLAKSHTLRKAENDLKQQEKKLRKKATKKALMKAHKRDPSSFSDTDFAIDPLQKVFKYYTGDDIEEFEEDFTYEGLAAISENEMAEKETDSSAKRDGKTRKAH
jgi:hypothetical protein